MRRRTTKSPPRKRTFLKVLAIALAVGVVAFGAAYIIAVQVLFPPLPEPVDGIVVPRLIGLTVPVAETQLRTLGLRVTEVSELAHPTQAAGVIIAQSPLPGQQLRDLGGIRLAISSGLPRAAVPNVVGLSVERARTVLSAIGFQVDETTEENTAAAGLVVRLEPPAGSDQAVPSRVVVFVSTGPPPPPDTLATPDTVPIARTTE